MASIRIKNELKYKLRPCFRFLSYNDIFQKYLRQIIVNNIIGNAHTDDSVSYLVIMWKSSFIPVLELIEQIVLILVNIHIELSWGKYFRVLNT